MVKAATEILDLLEPKVVLLYKVLSNDSNLEADFIVEGGLTMPLGQSWSARFDRGLQPNQQDHLHVMKHGSDIVIINRDGTPSHNTNLSDLPRRVRNQVKKLNLVYLEESGFLVETASFGGSNELERLIRLFHLTLERGH